MDRRAARNLRNLNGAWHHLNVVRAKTANELVTEGSAMSVIRTWVTATEKKIEIFPCAPGHGEIALEALQVTARSPLGAIAYETGGMLVDSGWIRVLGAGCPQIARTIAGWNGLPCDAGDAYLPGAMFVADDVLGGMYAIDVGALGGKRGNVGYYAPGALVWRDTGLSYGDWLRHILCDHDDLVAERWDGWEADVRTLPGTHAYMLDPPPWDAGPPFSDRARSPVTMRQLRDALLRR